MALTLSSLLNSPKFLCKYVKIHPPSAVICYAHSQLAVQPRNVERPIIFLCSKEKKKDLKRAPRKDIEDATKQLQFQPLRKEKASLQKIQTYQAVNAMWKRVGTLDIREKLVDESLLKKWNHDPLMDNKQLVLMVFEQDEATGKPSFSCTQNLPRSELGDKDTLPKTPAKKLKVEQIYSHSDSEFFKEVPQVSRWCEPDKNLQQVSCISHRNISLGASISEATMLFADHGHLNDSAKKEKKKSGFKIGPDPTQLSSVLLELRDEIPEFFLKKPNYSIYHQNVRFVNNITGTTTNGIYQYRAQISSFRLMIFSCMTELSVDVLKISKHPNEGSIKVRWRIKGIPLIRKFLPYIGRRVREGEDCYRYLDGFSVFEVGSDGLIHCHRLHKVMPSSSHEKENPLWMVFLLPFIRLLDPKSCESFIAFECRSTDEDHVDSLAKSDALTCLSS